MKGKHRRKAVLRDAAHDADEAARRSTRDAELRERYAVASEREAAAVAGLVGDLFKATEQYGFALEKVAAADDAATIAVRKVRAVRAAGLGIVAGVLHAMRSYDSKYSTDAKEKFGVREDAMAAFIEFSDRWGTFRGDENMTARDKFRNRFGGGESPIGTDWARDYWSRESKEDE